jgi:hypothetical protein
MVNGRGMGWRKVFLPKIASTIWSVSLIAFGKSSVKGIERFLSCVDRR